MKKILFATTAIALGAAAAPSFAAEKPTAELRGYVGVGMVYGDGQVANANGGTDDGFGLFHDGEVHFRWSGSSDNGLTFSGEIEMEAFNTGGGDDIDEYWTKVSGSFGEIMIGGDDTAYYNTSFGTVGAPLYKFGYWDHFGFAAAGYNGYSYTSDDLGIHYYTPDFNGFSAGISYQPDGQNDGVYNGTLPTYAGDDDGDNVISLGGSYMGEFDAFSFGIGGGYETADGDNMDSWRVDGKVGYAGFMLTAIYEDNNGVNTGQDLGIGAQYVTGPWTIAGGWSTTFDSANDDDVIAGWVTYAIMPGVNGTLAVEYSSAEFAPAGQDDEAIVGGAYMVVGF